jgi:putative hemolysin
MMEIAMTLRSCLAMAALAFGLAAAPAQAYVASNGLVVQPVNATDFFVAYRGRSAAASFWCAAGDFVVWRLRLPPGTRVFRLSAPPRRGGDGILFSLSAEGAQDRGVQVWGSKDKGMSASLAQTYCANEPPLFPSFWD